ncbi:DUF4328 domain-containing protein [Asanoa sp. NPDC050611]|uniref:DUF4328 domain-containing protein n=1 Tax=Asanoa sp. NPDC050611 TaxID=3157098 RepID=UPI0033CA687F
MSEAVFEGHRTYRVRGPGVAAVVAVGLAALAMLAIAVLLWAITVTVDRPGAAVDENGLTQLERLLEPVEWGYVGAQALALVLTMIWLWRARKNLDAFPGTEPLFSAGWAIGGWFFPIANLFVPGRLMANLARQSSREWWVRAAAVVWWCALVVHFAVDRVTNTAAETSLGRSGYGAWSEYYRDLAVGDTVAGAAGVLAAAAFALTVSRVSAAQEERIHRGWYEEQSRVMGVTRSPAAPDGGGSATIGA